MKRQPLAHSAVAACLLLAGCGSSASFQPDPQQPLPPGRTDAPSRIVICPDGSSYDPSRNVCVATGAQQPGAPAPRTSSGDAAADQTDIAVQCAFSNGWVAVLPADRYPDDDSFLMQALIGMSEDPDFWANESAYAELRPHAAKPCTRQGQHFRVAPGAYFVLAGETGTYARRGSYGRNGYKRRIQVTRTAVNLRLASSDLTHTWECISCPFVAFLDPSTGRWRPGFVILERRASVERRGTDRYWFENVAVRNGRIRLRVVEAEQEVSRIDALVLRFEGKELLPLRGGEQSALAAIDGIDVELSIGKQIEVEYEVPGVQDGVVAIELVAHGHYDPVGH